MAAVLDVANSPRVASVIDVTAVLDLADVPYVAGTPDVSHPLVRAASPLLPMHGSDSKHLHASAPFLIGTGPPEVLCARDYSRSYRVLLNVPRSPVPLRLVPHPMVIRFALPERLTGATQQSIRLSRGEAFQRFEQLTGSFQWQQQHVDMVGHDGECAQPVMTEFDPFEQGRHNYFGDGYLPQVQRPRCCSIEITVHPNEGLSCGELVRWRIPVYGKTPMQVPRDEWPAMLGMHVRESAGCDHCFEVRVNHQKSRQASPGVATRHARVRAPQTQGQTQAPHMEI